ncbi:MAG: hypothetical protein ACK5FF_06355 [Planctomyces sp.]
MSALFRVVGHNGWAKLLLSRSTVEDSGGLGRSLALPLWPTTRNNADFEGDF